MDIDEVRPTQGSNQHKNWPRPLKEVSISRALGYRETVRPTCLLRRWLAYVSRGFGGRHMLEAEKRVYNPLISCIRAGGKLEVLSTNRAAANFF